MGKYLIAAIVYFLFMIASLIGMITNIVMILDEEALLFGTLGVEHYLSFIIAFLVFFTLSFVGFSRTIARSISYAKDHKNK